jgi:hypothetical protein
VLAEAKQRWPIIGWVTKAYYLELLLASEDTLVSVGLGYIYSRKHPVVGYGIRKACTPAMGTLIG